MYTYGSKVVTHLKVTEQNWNIVFALELKGVGKSYPNGVDALKDIHLQVKPGEFFGLLGPNGAGKSTAIGIITTLVQKTSGKVSLFGVDLDRSPAIAKAFVGVVPQEFNVNIFDTVQDVVVNQAGYYGIPRAIAIERAEYYLEKLGLIKKQFDKVHTLSGGMKRRLMIARGLVHQPKLLILDEPSAGVDIELRHEMWDFLIDLNQTGTTIILTTHYLEEAEKLCRHIAIMNHGEIIHSASTKTLMGQMRAEHLLLELKSPIHQAPVLENMKCLLVDDLTLEVHFERTQTMNRLFSLLSAQGVEVLSIRNKMGRLETLFVDLVKC